MAKKKKSSRSRKRKRSTVNRCGSFSVPNRRLPRSNIPVDHGWRKGYKRVPSRSEAYLAGPYTTPLLPIITLRPVGPSDRTFRRNDFFTSQPMDDKQRLVNWFEDDPRDIGRRVISFLTLLAALEAYLKGNPLERDSRALPILSKALGFIPSFLAREGNEVRLGNVFRNVRQAYDPDSAASSNIQQRRADIMEASGIIQNPILALPAPAAEEKDFDPGPIRPLAIDQPIKEVRRRPVRRLNLPPKSSRDIRNMPLLDMPPLEAGFDRRPIPIRRSLDTYRRQPVLLSGLDPPAVLDRPPQPRILPVRRKGLPGRLPPSGMPSRFDRRRRDDDDDDDDDDDRHDRGAPGITIEVLPSEEKTYGPSPTFIPRHREPEQRRNLRRRVGINVRQNIARQTGEIRVATPPLQRQLYPNNGMGVQAPQRQLPVRRNLGIQPMEIEPIEFNQARTLLESLPQVRVPFDDTQGNMLASSVFDMQDDDEDLADMTDVIPSFDDSTAMEDDSMHVSIPSQEPTPLLQAPPVSRLPSAPVSKRKDAAILPPSIRATKRVRATPIVIPDDEEPILEGRIELDADRPSTRPPPLEFDPDDSQHTFDDSPQKRQALVAQLDKLITQGDVSKMDLVEKPDVVFPDVPDEEKMPYMTEAIYDELPDPFGLTSDLIAKARSHPDILPDEVLTNVGDIPHEPEHLTKARSVRNSLLGLPLKTIVTTDYTRVHNWHRYIGLKKAPITKSSRKRLKHQQKSHKRDSHLQTLDDAAKLYEAGVLADREPRKKVRFTDGLKGDDDEEDDEDEAMKGTGRRQPIVGGLRRKNSRRGLNQPLQRNQQIAIRQVDRMPGEGDEKSLGEQAERARRKIQSAPRRRPLPRQKQTPSPTIDDRDEAILANALTRPTTNPTLQTPEVTEDDEDTSPGFLSRLFGSPTVQKVALSLADRAALALQNRLLGGPETTSSTDVDLKEPWEIVDNVPDLRTRSESQTPARPKSPAPRPAPAPPIPPTPSSTPRGTYAQLPTSTPRERAEGEEEKGDALSALENDDDEEGDALSALENDDDEEGDALSALFGRGAIQGGQIQESRERVLRGMMFETVMNNYNIRLNNQERLFPSARNPRDSAAFESYFLRRLVDLNNKRFTLTADFFDDRHPDRYARNFVFTMWLTCRSSSQEHSLFLRDSDASFISCDHARSLFESQGQLNLLTREFA
jgi:hypothetical protein